MRKEAKIYNGQQPVIDWVRIANGTRRQTCKTCKYINLETGNFTEKFNPPGTYEKILYSDRAVSTIDVKKQSLALIPGFKLSWFYSGMKVEPYPYYSTHVISNTFVRKNSKLYLFEVLRLTPHVKNYLI